MTDTPWQRLLLGLGFLSRLGPARAVEPAQLGATMAFFPVAGALIGLALVTLPALGLFADHPMLQAWFLVAMNLVLTRGLHWDGWADLWDGWGSGARGEDFWRIVKDSRAGAFAVMGLVLGLGAQGLLFTHLCEAGALGSVIWCLVAGRLAMVHLALWGRTLARPGLAQAFLSEVDSESLGLAAFLALLLGLVLTPLAVILLTVLLALAANFMLRALAQSVQGLNGDFLGAACIAGELAAALAWVWAA